MTQRRKIINITIGFLLCIGILFYLWSIPDVMVMDQTLHEAAAQDPSLLPKVWAWRIGCTVLASLVFFWIIQKNIKPQKLK